MLTFCSLSNFFFFILLLEIPLNVLDMNINFWNNVFDLENKALKKINRSNLWIMSEGFAPNFPNLKIQTSYPTSNIKTTSNKFSLKILTTISHANSIENSKLNKQQNNFNLTEIVSNQYPILIIIILEYKTLSARPSSGATCQNWRKTEG